MRALGETTRCRAGAVRPGPAARRRSGATAALLAGIILLAGCSGSGTSASGPSPASEASGIGDWPSFLPSPTSQGVARGSIAAPAMSYPGSPVVVTTGSGDVLVDVEGPSYPADTKVGAEQVRCTFTVTLSKASTTVALRDARFDVLDHTGVVHPLKAEPETMPASIAPGETVALHLVATVPSGEGLVRFYPSGSDTASGWDYVAETD